ncbi:MAG TPA: tannase/feruloyl esterase family alpha/beta hydrolase [Vicinamibacteria bacterium]|nr:tannase/feruloyl esterase family alpha/beta hydrolase [Vicinamibacteria bacterium]
MGAVVDWVERQAAPQAIRATSRRQPGRSRPLCAYPSHAHYKGTGDVEDAASFECR